MRSLVVATAVAPFVSIEIAGIRTDWFAFAAFASAAAQVAFLCDQHIRWRAGYGLVLLIIISACWWWDARSIPRGISIDPFSWEVLWEETRNGVSMMSFCYTALLMASLHLFIRPTNQPGSPRLEQIWTEVFVAQVILACILFAAPESRWQEDRWRKNPFWERYSERVDKEDEERVAEDAEPSPMHNETEQ